MPSRLVANAHFMWAFCFVTRFVTRSVSSQISLQFELTIGHVTGFGKIWHQIRFFRFPIPDRMTSFSVKLLAPTEN